MSGLYTRFMEWIMPFLEANWQLFLIMAGALFLLRSSAGNGSAILRGKMDWAFALLSIGTLEKKGIASCRESAELSLSCAARCCGY